ncbi:hypothetical protein SCHPADRAFT_795959, partial [Schizopora paradoxa]
NPAAGASSIASIFPQVHPDILSLVLRHELRAEDLYKLDFRFRAEQESDLPLTVRNGLLRYAGTEVGTRYKTPDSIIHPFLNYITIISSLVIPAGNGLVVIAALNEYLHQLLRHSWEYEWPAVVAYHMAFWAYRCHEMRAGDYSRWAIVDQHLHSVHLLNHIKRSH